MTNTYISTCQDIAQYCNIISQTNKCNFLNLAVGFDIETSSFYDDGEKRGIMYTWQLMIEDVYITGRTWQEFINCLDALEYHLKLSSSRKLVIYVHNLAYEFAFMRRHLNITSQFFIAERNPLYICHNDTIIFKCSYQLTGLSLANVGEQIGYNKALGDLDYKKIRHSKTPLSEKEKEYNKRDVEIIVRYIRTMIKEYNGINNIPLTATGIVRKYCREKLTKDDKICYSSIIRNCTPNAEQFEQLHQCFMGGYVHANYMLCNMLLEDVHSYDFTSSYPYVLLVEKFPMKFHKLTIKKLDVFYSFLKKYACMFTITLHNVESTTVHHIISTSKCITDGDRKTDNGRIISSDVLQINLTDVDFEYLQKFYTWDEDRIYIKDFYFAKKERLPKEFLECILDFYEKKTTLKGVKGMEDIYLKYKGMLNALYGMCVTNPCKDKIVYVQSKDDYDYNEVNIEKKLNSLRYSLKNNFLLYQWGVWVTAYARRNLLLGLYEVGDDAVYCDTDSLKFLFFEEHKEYFTKYNENVIIKLKEVAEYLGIAFERFEPKDIKGKKHLIGVWDYEGMYTKFKTLGAKRYMGEKNNADPEITVAGLPKTAVYYIMSQENPYNFFEHDMVIPAGKMDIKNGIKDKLAMTYIDMKTSGYVTDYTGVTYSYEELTSVHSQSAPFKLNLTDDFMKLITGHLVDERTGKPMYEQPDPRLRFNFWE